MLKEKMTVSEEQMDQFRLLLASDNITDSMAPNFRPTMPLNDRAIYKCQSHLESDALFADNDEKEAILLNEQNDDGGMTEGELKWRIIGYGFISLSIVSIAICMVIIICLIKHWDQICVRDYNPKYKNSRHCKLEVQPSESQTAHIHDQNVRVIGGDSGHGFAL